MAYKIAKEFRPEGKSLAAAYSDTMLDVFEKNSKVVQLEADLAMCIWADRYAEVERRFPKQFLNMGIQEANMVGVACGLSLKGFVPYVHSFSGFVARRANDQIFISGCFNQANVRLVGSDPGIMAAYNGGTHMPFEDIGAIRSFAGITIIEPVDNVQLDFVLRETVDMNGMIYIRLTRGAVDKIYEDGATFEIGKGNLVIDGRDVTIISSGAVMLRESVKAALLLKEKDISARVIDMFTVKPVDSDLIVQSAKETGAIVTAENHNTLGGLGSAVSEVIGAEYPVPIERIGVVEQFGEVGSVDYLLSRFNMTAGNIAEAVQRAISRK